MSQTPVYTIGYGDRDIETFIAVLRANHIAYLLDVRSRPFSRYKPDFGQPALERHLKQAGVRYVYLGDTLGGQPADPDCYTDGKVDYDKCRDKPFFQEGIGRVVEAWRQGLAVALMCSEGRPESCHRSKLIGVSLESLGVNLTHIDERDQLVSQADVLLRLTGGQASLFGAEFQQFRSRKRYQPEAGEQGSE